MKKIGISFCKPFTLHQKNKITTKEIILNFTENYYGKFRSLYVKHQNLGVAQKFKAKFEPYPFITVGLKS